MDVISQLYWSTESIVLLIFLCIVFITHSRFFCLPNNKINKYLYILTQPIQVTFGQKLTETLVC